MVFVELLTVGRGTQSEKRKICKLNAIYSSNIVHVLPTTCWQQETEIVEQHSTNSFTCMEMKYELGTCDDS